MSAGFLLAVERDADVDRQLSFARQELDSLQEEIGVALVVHGAARVEVAVAKHRLERIRLPELEWSRGLDVEVAVEEDRRRRAVPARRRDLAHGERERGRLDQLGLTPRAPHELAHP